MNNNNRVYKLWLPYLIGGGFLVVIAAFIKDIYPIGVDWEYTFSLVDIYWQNPYQIPTFVNFPWVLFFLPHAWLPLNWGNALNFLLNVTLLAIITRRFGGGWQTYILVFTSPFFFDLARTNNIEWIPLLSLLLPPPYGLPLLILKPQSFGGIIIIWLKKYRWRLLWPTILILVVSLFVWRSWFLQITPPLDVSWNFSMWPMGIPLGLYMLYKAYKSDDELIAAAATPFLVPYVAPYSLVNLLAILGGKYKREVFYVYVATWAYFIIQLRRDGF